MLEVGRNIRTIRELKNLTQDYLASQLTMSIANYSNIENGKTDITLTRLQQIAKVLQVDYKQILSFNPGRLLNGSDEAAVDSRHNGFHDELVRQLQIKDEQIHRLLSLVEEKKGQN